MKKILAILLAGLLTLSIVSCGDKKENEEENEKESSNVEQNYIDEATNKGRFEYALNTEGDYEITKYIPYAVTAESITLPKEVNGRDIVGIAENAFKGKASNAIKSVTVPNTYKYIGDYAFYDCDSLVTITLPETIESIGVSAFRDCEILTDFTVPASVKVISEYAFMDCKAIKALDLSNVTTICKGAFLNCTALESITISDKIEYATKDAFQGCTALVYNEEAELKYLGNSANKNILLVSPASLILTECVVNGNTKVIADAAFNNCKYLTKITLSDSVKVINGTSFENCPEINYNKSENGLYLGTEANPYMVLIEVDITSVKEFKLNKDTKIITNTAFAKSNILEKIGFAGTVAEWNAIIKSADWNGDINVSVICSDETIDIVD